jgi:hypothetical protein
VDCWIQTENRQQSYSAPLTHNPTSHSPRPSPLNSHTLAHPKLLSSAGIHRQGPRTNLLTFETDWSLFLGDEDPSRIGTACFLSSRDTNTHTHTHQRLLL